MYRVHRSYIIISAPESIESYLLEFQDTLSDTLSKCQDR